MIYGDLFGDCSARRLQLTGELLRRVAGANYSQLRQLERISGTYIEVEPRKKNARPNDVILALYGPSENIQVRAGQYTILPPLTYPDHFSLK